jgi:hypothetical protein
VIETTRTIDRRAGAAWLRRFSRTTPGVISLVAVLVAGVCVVAGLVVGGQLDGRIAEHTAVLDRTEPFANAAQNLYVALSAADAASASAFLAGEETGPTRQQYQQALADAAAALTDVTSGTTDHDTRTAAADISAQLTAYTGLVEAARANSRQGFPVGSAYLREASSLMKDTMLPGANEIFTKNLAALDADQQAIGGFPLVSIALLAVALAAIAVGSVIVYARTNRTFNLGLVVAALLIVVVAAWVVIATQLAGGAAEKSRATGTQRLEQLANARILAQKARTEETLLLITRGDATASDKAYQDLIEELRGRVHGTSTPTLNAVNDWTASHDVEIQKYRDGDYNGAVDQAIGGDENASAAHFAAADAALHADIETTRTQLRDDVSKAGTWLTFSPTGTLVLMVFAAAAAVVGLWPRLKEFL